MPNVLLTGFGPFENTPVNPAEAVMRVLDGTRILNSDICGLLVQNNFFESIDTVTDAIAQMRPQLVIMMGEYGGRAEITVERIAQNFNDSTRYSLKDNRGMELQGEPTVEDGPAAYRSNLPLRAMVKAMRSAGVPADISDNAATFGCNHLMYGVLHYVAVNQLDILTGWIHLPRLPEIAALPENLGTPSMSRETAALGVHAAIEAALTHPQDINEPIPSRLQI
ncbi:pyroglutamyl-peptidase I [Microbulbifer sp. OS29]|uniref:Pyroglutamyl-peptidase I n=1 Tax=Microbulbifer okhotskensis TaxID=2926617 RepID=A0A9X2EQY3_9GAMM|nr:pyroglutamyl-peptidase I [Microbulbifer okhotskensis]MCO1336160.1 pyroglutamyl-peptidase I [Microbulbifer okhotskensis]